MLFRKTRYDKNELFWERTAFLDNLINGIVPKNLTGLDEHTEEM